MLFRQSNMTSFCTGFLLIVYRSVVGPFNYSVVGHTVFAVGRFLCALVEVFFKPSHILLFLSMGMIVTSALAMSLVGPAGIAMIVLCQFFEVCSSFVSSGS